MRSKKITTERIMRDAIISYSLDVLVAPSEEAKCDIVNRARFANRWLVSHGYEPEITHITKEVAK